MDQLVIGDKVKYSRNFLRSTGMLTGAIPFARGTIVSLEDFGYGKLAAVDWGSPEIPRKVLSSNLVQVGDIEHV